MEIANSEGSLHNRYISGQIENIILFNDEFSHAMSLFELNLILLTNQCQIVTHISASVFILRMNTE